MNTSQYNKRLASISGQYLNIINTLVYSNIHFSNTVEMGSQKITTKIEEMIEELFREMELSFKKSLLRIINMVSPHLSDTSMIIPVKELIKNLKPEPTHMKIYHKLSSNLQTDINYFDSFKSYNPHKGTVLNQILNDTNKPKTSTSNQTELKYLKMTSPLSSIIIPKILKRPAAIEMKGIIDQVQIKDYSQNCNLSEFFKNNAHKGGNTIIL